MSAGMNYGNALRSTSCCFNLIATWVEALHGQGELSDNLNGLMKLVRADAIVFSRFEEDQAKPKIISRVDPQASMVPTEPRCPPLARIALGQHLCAVQPGTVWVKSECGELSLAADSIQLRELTAAHSLRDVVLIALETGSGCADFLELHFRSNIVAHDRDLLAVLSPTLAKTWKSRIPGTAASLITAWRKVGLSVNDEIAQRAILTTENPVGLSRSEYRVCTLIKDGLVVRKIAVELAIKESTVRSHLRSIYAKTETSGQVELLYRLAQTSASTSPGQMSA